MKEYYKDQSYNIVLCDDKCTWYNRSGICYDLKHTNTCALYCQNKWNFMKRYCEAIKCRKSSNSLFSGRSDIIVTAESDLTNDFLFWESLINSFISNEINRSSPFSSRPHYIRSDSLITSECNNYRVFIKVIIID